MHSANDVRIFARTSIHAATKEINRIINEITDKDPPRVKEVIISDDTAPPAASAEEPRRRWDISLPSDERAAKEPHRRDSSPRLDELASFPPRRNRSFHAFCSKAASLRRRFIISSVHAGRMSTSPRMFLLHHALTTTPSTRPTTSAADEMCLHAQRHVTATSGTTPARATILGLTASDINRRDYDFWRGDPLLTSNMCTTAPVYDGAQRNDVMVPIYDGDPTTLDVHKPCFRLISNYHYSVCHLTLFLFIISYR